MIVAACFPPQGWGGAEVAAEGIAQWLSARGHAIAIYTDADPAALSASDKTTPTDWYAPDKNGTHRAHEHSRQSAVRKAWWHFRDHGAHQGEAAFARATAAFEPDLVMVHLAPGLGLGLFAHCAAHDLPVLFVLHDFWMTCLRSSMFSRGGSVCTQREALCRWSSHHRLAALSKVPRLGFWAPSRRITEIIRDQVGAVFPRLLVERNIVDLDDFTFSSAPPEPGPVRFLYVGKITEAKGARFVLECLSLLPASAAFVIDILGSGDLESSLRLQFEHDPRFRFHGVQQRAQVAEFYRRASVLLIPSLWFENSPLVIYQAQAAGVPVVGSDSGGIPELLAGRDDSIVLAAGDRVAWLEQLARLVVDPEWVNQLGNAAKRRARHSGDDLAERGRKVEAFCQALIELPAQAGSPHIPPVAARPRTSSATCA